MFNQSKALVEKLKPIENTELDVDQKPVWTDDDDQQLNDNNVIKNQNSHNLKHRFETLMGTPSWAKLNRKIVSEDDDDLLRTVGHIQKRKTVHLPKDFLETKMLPLINSETKNEGRFINHVVFHPKLSVALVAGNSGIVSLFSIGGDVNNKLHSFKLKNWKVTAAEFTPDGSEAYLASNSNHSYCVYDLVKAEPKLIQLPHVVKRPKIFNLSLDGKYIAVSDGFDEIFIISSASKELLRSLKHNSSVESVTFSSNSEQLYCYCIQGEVTVWDLSTFRAIKKFYDNGCVNASCITMSPCGRLLATGSREGIVNIYETSTINTLEPIPLKTISNLTTKITNLRFNATSEILAASSSIIQNAVKLIHIPSHHIFTNFPDQSKGLSHVQTVNFSPNSGYMAVGNDKGCANLYRLKYYKNY